MRLIQANRRAVAHMRPRSRPRTNSRRSIAENPGPAVPVYAGSGEAGFARLHDRLRAVLDADLVEDAA